MNQFDVRIFEINAFYCNCLIFLTRSGVFLLIIAIDFQVQEYFLLTKKKYLLKPNTACFIEFTLFLKPHYVTYS